jgi:hypothetical protein
VVVPKTLSVDRRRTEEMTAVRRVIEERLGAMEVSNECVGKERAALFKLWDRPKYLCSSR